MRSLLWSAARYGVSHRTRGSACCRRLYLHFGSALLSTRCHVSARGFVFKLLDASFPPHVSPRPLFFSSQLPNHIVTATVRKKISFFHAYFHSALSISRGHNISVERGAAALEKPTVIKAPQPRVGDIAILLVMMRRGIASRAVHGGNPRHSAVLSGNKSSVYRRETSSGSDME